MANDIYTTVKDCHKVVQNRLSDKHRRPSQLLPVNGPLAFVAMHILGTQPKTSNRVQFEFVMTDRYSKYLRSI